MLLGERFDAVSAQQKGFVNAVISHEELLDYARNQALKLADKPPAAMVAAKALLKSQRGRPLSQVLETERALFAKHLRSPEAQEALLAFKQRRKPDFSEF